MSVPCSPRSRLALLSVVLVTFLGASSAPTPLYHLYQEAWHFSPGMLTLVFGVYAFSLLAALLTLGSLSDYLGRKPVVRAAIVLNMLAMALFIYADSVGWLLAARVVQGFATGIATSAVGAALIDTDRQKGSLLNSLSPLLGLALGALGASALAQYTTYPLQLSYGLLAVLMACQVLLLAALPESISRQPGALASLRPTLSLPVQARATLWRVMPVNVAVWMSGGFFLSLAPSLVRAATGSSSNLIGGALVATLNLSGAAAIYALRNSAPERTLRLGTLLLGAGVGLLLIATWGAMLPLFFIATLVTGLGFGSGFLGGVRSVMPLAHAHERAGLMATFYVLSYLAFCLPAMGAGFLVRDLGLVPTTYAYGGVQIALCLAALAGMWRRTLDPATVR